MRFGRSFSHPAVDFLITRRPHEVSLREATLWSAFYVALPLSFGGWVWARYGSERGTAEAFDFSITVSCGVLDRRETGGHPYVAQVILAETGGDMTRFSIGSTPGRLGRSSARHPRIGR